MNNISLKDLCELGLGWDDFMDKVIRHKDVTRDMAILYDIYFLGYKTRDYLDNVDKDCAAYDIGLCYEIRQFAVNNIVDLIYKGANE